jgi:hypothetical protein
MRRAAGMRPLRIAAVYMRPVAMCLHDAALHVRPHESTNSHSLREVRSLSALLRTLGLHRPRRAPAPAAVSSGSHATGLRARFAVARIVGCWPHVKAQGAALGKLYEHVALKERDTDLIDLFRPFRASFYDIVSSPRAAPWASHHALSGQLRSLCYQSTHESLPNREAGPTVTARVCAV